ncbi:MAG: type II secretion system protein GspC [Gammaproteobacteria bacterium]|nr:type II secretion system protein GspC [Gammaproteobacteria bacterium]
MQLPQSLSRLATLTEGARSSRWMRSLPLWVSVALTVVLAWQLVQLGWAILGARTAPAPGTSAAPAAVASPAGPAVDLQAILSAHLFGLAGAPPAGATDPNSVAATQMNLVLVGTIAESDPARGYAIIGESAANAKVYAVGKTISGGTKLHAVYPDRAILDRGGKLEALLLPRKFTGAGLSPVAMQGPQQADPLLGDRLRNLASENPAAITEILRPQPVFANGQQRGYRVYPGRNREIFTKLGLMPGDLVTAINGTPLDDPTKGMEIMQTMNSATDVTVTVERNGQTTQININNAQIAAQAAAAAAQPEAIPVSEAPEVAPRQDLSE